MSKCQQIVAKTLYNGKNHDLLTLADITITINLLMSIFFYT
jgi:hypothetical protein